MNRLNIESRFGDMQQFLEMKMKQRFGDKIPHVDEYHRHADRWLEEFNSHRREGGFIRLDPGFRDFERERALRKLRRDGLVAFGFVLIAFACIALGFLAGVIANVIGL